MKMVFAMDYGRAIVMSIKDAQTMLELLSRSSVCKRDGYGESASYTPTSETVEMRMINDDQLVDEETKNEG